MNEVGELVHPVAVEIVYANPVFMTPPLYGGNEQDTTGAYVEMTTEKAVPDPTILEGVMEIVLTVLVVTVELPDMAPVDVE
jgi:hypothetical protein